MLKRILNHFNWTKWESQWIQLDKYKKTRYEVFKSTNKNWLTRYTKILVVSASCYPSDATYE